MEKATEPFNQTGLQLFIGFRKRNLAIVGQCLNNCPEEEGDKRTYYFRAFLEFLYEYYFELITFIYEYYFELITLLIFLTN